MRLQEKVKNKNFFKKIKEIKEKFFQQNVYVQIS